MKKLEPPRIGAAVSGAVRSALERVRGNGRRTAGGGADAPARAPDSESRLPTRAAAESLDVAEERAASRDLLAIDALVRRFYALSSGARGAAEWERFRALFHPGARLGSGRADPASPTGLDDVPLEQFVEASRESGIAPRYAERSRTVHVLGDLAVVVSTFEVQEGAQLRRGVHLFLLRLAPGGAWLVQSVIARPEERAVTEKSADPRPLASRPREP